MTTQTITAPVAEPRRRVTYLPREHGATAMLLTPIVAVAILAREWRWAELATLAAAFAAISAKDPIVLLVRQRFLWKRPHPDAPAALRWSAAYVAILALSGVVLFLIWPLPAFLAMGAGIAAFTLLAVLVNVKNLQRSTLFQITSAAALTSTALATCLSASGQIAQWCWWYWILSILQSSAGILVVHARLDARIALRKPAAANPRFRRAAKAAVAILFCAAVAAALLRRWPIALALLIAAAGYSYDLVRQRTPAALELHLMRVGQRALLLSSVFAALLIVGLW